MWHTHWRHAQIPHPTSSDSNRGWTWPGLTEGPSSLSCFVLLLHAGMRARQACLATTRSPPPAEPHAPSGWSSPPRSGCAGWACVRRSWPPACMRAFAARSAERAPPFCEEQSRAARQSSHSASAGVGMQQREGPAPPLEIAFTW